MTLGCEKTKQFIEEFNQVKSCLHHLQITSAITLTAYFSKKVGDHKITVFDTYSSTSIINDIFQLKTTPELRHFLEESNFWIIIPNHPSGQTRSKLSLTIADATDEIKVTSADRSYISPRQLRYLEELQYALSLAYRLNKLSSALNTLQQALKPLLDAYKSILTGGSISESLEDKQADIQLFLDSTINWSSIESAHAQISGMEYHHPFAIEKLLEHAYNEHTQGKLVQREWQTQVVMVIAKEIEKTARLTSFYNYFSSPRLQISNSQQNKLQRDIRFLDRWLNKDNTSIIIREFTQFTTKLLQQSNLPQHADHQVHQDIDALKSNFYANQRRLLACSRNQHALHNELIDLATILNEFLFLNLSFNKYVRQKNYMSYFHEIAEYISDITLKAESGDLNFAQQDAGKLRRMLEIMTNLRETNILFEKTSWFEKFLALIHKIIPLFQEFFIKAQNDKAFKLTEKLFGDLIIQHQTQHEFSSMRPIA
jgi:hypothetical protein